MISVPRDTTFKFVSDDTVIRHKTYGSEALLGTKPIHHSCHPAQNLLVRGPTRHKTHTSQLPSGTKSIGQRPYSAQNPYITAAIRHKIYWSEALLGTKSAGLQIDGSKVTIMCQGQPVKSPFM